MIKTIVKKNNYLDSIFLMKASKEVMHVEGVKNAVVVMGTDMNKTVLEEFGGLSEEALGAAPNDLIISVDSEDEKAAEKAVDCIHSLLTEKQEKKTEEAKEVIASLEQALEQMEESNLVMISLPGEYAAMEARYALQKGKHVFIFSDLPIEDELELKRIGAENNLLVMGPGAGTAVIDGVSIGLMSKVRRGTIGIVAASGSGLQEVAVLVHQMGFGISQAIGTGGRDLSKDVGGSMMLRGIRLLDKDNDTKVIVLISKPPHPETMEKIFTEIKRVEKPVVIFFLGGDTEQIKESEAYAPATLEEAARMACDLAQGKEVKMQDYIKMCKDELQEIAKKEKSRMNSQQKYLRGLFCGGTHSEEAVTLLQDFVPQLHSNIRFGKSELLVNRHISIGNSLVDMGDEEFTKGRPHPVMDPEILNDRLLQEGSDPETAVILLDILLGHAVHPDPVGCIEETIRKIQALTQQEGRYVSVIASICGTDMDPQNYAEQERRLKELGVHIERSNSRAAMLAGMIVC